MYLKSIIISTIIALLPTFTLAEMVTVEFTGTQMRSEPYAGGSAVIKDLPSLSPLSVLEKGPEYYKVRDYRGSVGWVHSSLLGNAGSIVVTGDRANVRSGPGTSHNVVFQLTHGATARLLDKQDNWVEIETLAGKKGWIAGFLVWGD